MKTIFTKLILMSITAFIIGCSDDDTLSHTEVSSVNALYAPEDNTFMNLGAQSSALFEWQAAKAEDSGVVLYDVAFDTEEGDFSDPVYVMPSDGKGFQQTLNLPFSELSRIAGMAGIQPENTGKLKWTVFASKGLNIQQSEVSRVIEVERPGGFPTPDELYLTGTATETGDDLSAASAFTKTGASTFEIYTALKAGEYQLVTRNTGTPDTYFIEGNKLRADGSATYEAGEAVHRIRIDFSDGSVTVAQVEKMELWFAPFGEFLFELPYAGNGTWKAENEYIEFKQESWGRDERYKFRMTLTEGGNTLEEWYGSANADNVRPDENTPGSYWYMVPAPDDDWTNTFKFGDAADESNVDIEVIFNTEVPEYTHVVTVLD